MTPVHYEVDSGVAWPAVDLREARDALGSAVRGGLAANAHESQAVVGDERTPVWKGR